MREGKETKERILILSDFHIGGKHFDDERRGTLLRLLTSRGADFTRIILLGDIFELQQADAEVAIKQAALVMQTLAELAGANVAVDYVVGNHDIDVNEEPTFLDKHFGIPDSVWTKHYPHLDLPLAGKRVRFEHGHLHDPHYQTNANLYNQLSSTVGRWMAESPRRLDMAGDLLRRWDLLKQVFSSSKEKYTEKWDGPFSAFKVAACRLLYEHQPSYDRIVFGHTHYPYLREFMDGKIYVNSGCWTAYETCLTYDEATDDFNWLEGGLEPIREAALPLLLPEMSQRYITRNQPPRNLRGRRVI